MIEAGKVLPFDVASEASRLRKRQTRAVDPVIDESIVAWLAFTVDSISTLMEVVAGKATRRSVRPLAHRT